VLNSFSGLQSQGEKKRSWTVEYPPPAEVPGPWQRVRVRHKSVRSVRIADSAAVDPVRLRTGDGVEHSGGEIDVFPNIASYGSPVTSSTCAPAG